MSSNEIPKINEDLKNKERKLDDIENGGKGLSKLWFNLTAMNQRVSYVWKFKIIDGIFTIMYKKLLETIWTISIESDWIISSWL